MIEVIPLSPTNELRVAEDLRRLVLAEWPDIADSGVRDRVRIFVGLQANVEIDLVVEISLEGSRPLRGHRLRDGSYRQPASIQSGILLLEVKQLDRERFLIRGPEIFPIYGREPKKRSVGQQISDGVLALKKFLNNYALDPYVHGLGWLSDVPDEALVGIPNSIVGRDLTWSGLVQAAPAEQWNILSPQSPPYRRSIADAGEILAGKRFIPQRDRAAVDRLTNAVIANGRFEEIKAALGTRQVRLAGRAGSGKSTTIALLAQYLAQVRQERLLVLTYHHALRNELDRLIRSVVADDALVGRYVKVTTLVDFLASACGELGADLPKAEDRRNFQTLQESLRAFLAAAPSDSRRADVETLKELEPDRFAFDYVCIDESQDCSNVERDLLRMLFPPTHMVLADGLDQLVRRQTPCDWTTGIRPAERLHVDLGRSLRMARNVARFATAMAEQMGLIGWRIDPHPELTGGRIVIQRGDYDRELFDGIIGGLREANVPLKDLLVCVPPGEIVSDGIRRDSRVGRALRGWDAQVWNGCDEEVRRSEIATDQQVRVVQYDSMRGLEGWCTVLVALDEFHKHRIRWPNLQPNEQATPEEVARRWLLMAVTRAARSLVITLTDPSSAAGRWILGAAEVCKDVVEIRD